MVQTFMHHFFLPSQLAKDTVNLTSSSFKQKRGWWLEGIGLLLLICLLRLPSFATSWQTNGIVLLLNRNYATPESFVVNPSPLTKLDFRAWAYQNEHSDSAWAQAGLAYLLQNQIVPAEEAWRNSTLAADELLQYAVQARELGHSELALQICDLTIAVDPTLRDSWYYKGDILIDQGHFEEGEASFLQGVTGTEHGRIGQSDFYLRLGELYAFDLPKPDTEKAQTMYSQAILVDDFQTITNQIRTHYLNGEAYLSLSQPTEAMEMYELVLAKNQNHYWANVRLGVLLGEQAESFDRAEALLLQAIQTDPRAKGAYKGLGRLYLENGRFTAAQKMFEQVLQLDPSDPQAIDALATIRNTTP